MVKVIRELKEWQKIRAGITTSVGFVATMGNLHAGHRSLLQRSKRDNAITVLSIFINPTQFNDQTDYQRYPRTEANDLAIAAEEQIDYVLIPEAGALYPEGYRYRISEHKLATVMEGKYRPGHFEGMLTIVMKLLQLVQPTRTYFGEKDYQQLQLVKGLVEAFFLPVDVIAAPTLRETSGLALSSRNHLLSEERREFAAHLYKHLCQADPCDIIQQKLEALGFGVDYIEEHQQRRFAAVSLDGVRLIDNVPLSS